MKRERTRPAAVIAALRMHTSDKPRSALKPQREEALDMRGSRGRLAVSLAHTPKLGQPLRTATRRTGEHTVAAVPERKAAIHRLFESHQLNTPKRSTNDS